MDTNQVTEEAAHRIEGAKLRNSFVESPHVKKACDDRPRPPGSTACRR